MTRSGRWLRLGDHLLLAVLIVVLAALVYRVSAGLNYNWRWSVIARYAFLRDPETGRWAANTLLRGFGTTLYLAVSGSILALVAGVGLGLGRLSGARLPRALARTYVELVRNTPPLVFVFVFYFFLSSQLQLGALASGVVCLAMLQSAYVAEIVRAGVQSVGRGQWEAAASLGLSRTTTLRDIVLPQALRRVLPPLVNQLTSLVKDSSIISLISIPELTYAASEVVASTRAVFEVWIFVAVLYFVLCSSIALLGGRLERRLSHV